MAGLDDLARSDIRELKRQVRELQMAAPLRNAAVGAGGIRVHSGGVITIENGGLKVTGTAEIIGRLLASGIVDFEGEVNITGPLDVSGLVTLMSDLVVASGGKIKAGTIELNPDGSAKFGTLLIDNAGKVTLQNDLVVAAGGKIKAGDTTILPSGAILFGDSLTIAPAGEFGPAGISDGFAEYTLTPGDPVYFHNFQGGVYVLGRIQAMDMVLSDLPTTTQPANLYVGSDGVLKKSTA